MLRQIAWDDLLADQFELGDSVVGWGLNFSSIVNVGKNDVLRLQYAYGRGIENYMNDSPVDVGIQNNLSNAVTPILGKPLPITGIVLFLDHTWNAKFSSAVGYSRQDIDNTDAQAPERVQGRPVRARQSAVYAGAERDDGRRVAVGPPRELLGRLSQ